MKTRFSLLAGVGVLVGGGLAKRVPLLRYAHCLSSRLPVLSCHFAPLVVDLARHGALYQYVLLPRLTASFVASVGQTRSCVTVNVPQPCMLSMNHTLLCKHSPPIIYDYDREKLTTDISPKVARPRASKYQLCSICLYQTYSMNRRSALEHETHGDL